MCFGRMKIPSPTNSINERENDESHLHCLLVYTEYLQKFLLKIWEIDFASGLINLLVHKFDAMRCNIVMVGVSEVHGDADHSDQFMVDGVGVVTAKLAV